MAVVVPGVSVTHGGPLFGLRLNRYLPRELS